MRLALSAFLLFAVAAVWARAGEENPFLNAKVGDWASYDMVNQMPNPASGEKMEMKGKIVMVVAEKDDKEAKLRVDSEMTLPGMPQPMKQSQTTPIPLDQPYDAAQAMAAGVPGMNVTPGKPEPKTIEAAGKTWDCEYSENKVENPQAGMTIVAKIWTSKELPFRLVRMESATNAAGMSVESTMVITGSGDAANAPK